MKVNRPRLLVFLFLFLPAFSIPIITLGQESIPRNEKTKQDDSKFVREQREAVEKNPKGITFTLRLKDNKRVFRQGELIRLEFSFASTEPNAYTLDTASYDRSGRLHMDSFHVDPENHISDPLADHFDGFIFMMGGLRGIADLKEQPELLTFELNEWFRFDKPGKYRLYVTSPRVGRGKKLNFLEGEIPSVTSNIVEFEIIAPDPVWQAKEFQRAVQLSAPKKKNENWLEAGDRQRLAKLILRFLDSKASLQEMIRRLGNETENTADYYFGLFGSTQREFIVEEMEKRMDDPEQAISRDYINALTRLTRALQFPGASLKSSKTLEGYSNLIRQIRARYTQRLANAISQKRGKAKAISLDTLLKETEDEKLLQQNANELTKVFFDLPKNKQRDLLSYQWKKIASPTMLPILRKLYETPSTKSHAREDNDLREVRNLTLRRIFELAPSEGRDLILQEIRNLNSEIHPSVLSLLPDKTIPELDETLAGLLEESEDKLQASALIERYASSGIYPLVRKVYSNQGGLLDCSLQSSLLAYFLRVEPTEGAELVRQAIKARSDTRCYSMVFRDISELHNCPELEKIAIEFLDDSEPEVVTDAVQMLGEQGSASGEDALWQRIERLRREPENPLIEQALVKAILNSPAWLVDAKRMQKLKQFCRTKESQEEVERVERSLKSEIEISCRMIGSDWNMFEVAHYSFKSFATLKEKLLQFPKGTIFKWQGYGSESEETKWFSEIKELLESNGMSLKK